MTRHFPISLSHPSRSIGSKSGVIYSALLDDYSRGRVLKSSDGHCHPRSSRRDHRRTVQVQDGGRGPSVLAAAATRTRPGKLGETAPPRSGPDAWALIMVRLPSCSWDQLRLSLPDLLPSLPPGAVLQVFPFTVEPGPAAAVSIMIVARVPPSVRRPPRRCRRLDVSTIRQSLLDSGRGGAVGRQPPPVRYPGVGVIYGRYTT